jgi:hypothetical protein
VDAFLTFGNGTLLFHVGLVAPSKPHSKPLRNSRVPSSGDTLRMSSPHPTSFIFVHV